MMAELLALVDIADVHLNGGKINCLQRIKNGYAIVRERCRINDNAIKLAVSLLDGGDDVALVIALQKLHFHAQASCCRANIGAQALIVATAINSLFARAQHIDIRTV